MIMIVIMSIIIILIDDYDHSPKILVPFPLLVLKLKKPRKSKHAVHVKHAIHLV